MLCTIYHSTTRFFLQKVFAKNVVCHIPLNSLLRHSNPTCIILCIHSFINEFKEEFKIPDQLQHAYHAKRPVRGPVQCVR